MRTYLDCIPCFLRQSLEASRMVTSNETLHEIVLKKVMRYLQVISSFNNPPPELSKEVHAIVRNMLNCKDPYREVKKKSNEMANELYPRLEQIVEEAKDPFLMATKLAIIGNVIDFGAMNRFDVKDMINKAITENIDDNAYSRFKESIEKAQTILYLADNAGEIFFDKLLIKKFAEMGKRIVYAVKNNPIINDATIEDAKFAGIDKFAEVLPADEGQDKSAPGILLNYASSKFLNYFRNADVVIAKGQGNYESLSNSGREIFFLLVVKCPLVARDIRADIGNLILKVIE
ncbi:MAG TPA: DUF89 family protein [Thermoplasmatales archaeon]|nr:DUF89 family protein [Thermoplasmatales archaeon]